MAAPKIRSELRNQLRILATFSEPVSAGQMTEKTALSFTAANNGLQRCGALGLAKAMGMRGKAKLWQITDAGRAEAAKQVTAATTRTAAARLAKAEAVKAAAASEDDEEPDHHQRSRSGVRNFKPDGMGDRYSIDSIVAQAIRTQPTSIFDAGMRSVN